MNWARREQRIGRGATGQISNHDCQVQAKKVTQRALAAARHGRQITRMEEGRAVEYGIMHDTYRYLGMCMCY